MIQSSSGLYGILLSLLFAVQGEDGVQTDVYPKFDVSVLEPGRRLNSIWKLDVAGGTVLNLRAWTESEEKMIETGCDAWTLNFRLHRDSPSLPSSLRDGASEYLYEESVAWINESIQLLPIQIGSNDTNELTHTISFENNPGHQFLTSWVEQPTEPTELKRRIQNKLGISTQCWPKIQFNLTNSNNQSENDVIDDNGNIQQNLSGYRPLSKLNVQNHNVNFFVNDSQISEGITLNCQEETQNFFFEIDADSDVGGTMDFAVFNATTQMCLTQNRPEENTSCDKQYNLYHNQSFYMPQPTPGIWFIELKPLNCTGKDDEMIRFNVTLDGCVNQCGEAEGRGSCNTFYTQGGFLMSSCHCKAGYQGIACSDASDAMSIQVQLLELLLLTLSNLFFLPAIMISIHRRYWQEAIVFTIAMCCSTVYHACDQFSTQKYYCIADYDTLQFADFLAATSAMWVTVLAVADLPQRWAAVMQNTGIFLFAIGAHYNRFSVWLFAAPIVIGMAILMGHWIYQCRVRRDCYPPKRAWFCHLFPGMLFAIGGFLTKIIFEFEGMDGNYYWTHTMWHAFLGLSCAFLLPDISYDATKMYNPDSNNLISYYKSFDEPNFEPNVL